MRRVAKVDANHRQVRELFRAHGIRWRDTPLGAGFPDALVCFGDKLALLEIKAGQKGLKSTQPKTADAQRRFAQDFPVRRITGMIDAAETIAWLKAQVLSSLHGKPLP